MPPSALRRLAAVAALALASGGCVIEHVNVPDAPGGRFPLAGVDGNTVPVEFTVDGVAHRVLGDSHIEFGNDWRFAARITTDVGGERLTRVIAGTWSGFGDFYTVKEYGGATHQFVENGREIRMPSTEFDFRVRFDADAAVDTLVFRR